MPERITSKQWYRSRRLELAGLRLPKPLIAPNHPVRVEHLTHATVCDVFPIVNGVGVAVPVRIIAGVAITIVDYRLHWDEMPELSLPGKMKLLKSCPRCSRDYQPSYCFELPSGHYTTKLPNLQKEGRSVAMLKRNYSMKGCYSAWMEDQPRFSSKTVAASLHIIDIMGNEYPYPLRLRMHPDLLTVAAPTGRNQSPDHLSE
jgi:hypothetical protein